jgi:predicted RNA-binding Zn-ribbon protein involved in translation (DUF1610 family)
LNNRLDTETALIKCSNCGWEEEISGDTYELLFDGANVNRPGTKDHQIYKKRYCPDCGKQTFDGDRCSSCQVKYAQDNYNFD